MTAGEARAYVRCADGECVWRELEGLSLVFHRPSGLTHMLASPLPEIFEALDAKPIAAAGLLQRLSARFDLGEEGDALAALEAHLVELAALGLIGSQPCTTA